jgi:hypothetical protein
MELEYGETAADLLTDRRRALDEFTIQLVDAIAPAVLQGFCSMLDSAVTLCKEQGEEEKYLMAFQNMLARIPGWNSSLITKEVERITEASQIGYLPDLVVGVHIIHLRIMSSVRVGHKPKRIEIDPPDFDKFVHRVYCEAGRKMWTYAYLFRNDISDLDQQRNMHECEKIIRECVVSAVRASMPVETILRAYIDEAEEIRLDALEEAGMERAGQAGGGADQDGSNASGKSGGNVERTVDVESELKQISATNLPGVEAAEESPGGGDEDDDDADEDGSGENGTPTLRLSDESDPTAGLTVGFAQKNEVLDMGTNKTAEVEMSAGPKTPAALPGPPLEEVTLESLVSTPVSSAFPAPTRAPRPVATGGDLGIVPAGQRPVLPTLKLETGPW